MANFNPGKTLAIGFHDKDQFVNSNINKLLICWIALLGAAQGAGSAPSHADSGCLACHSADGLAAGHRFASDPCTRCHGGQGDAENPTQAHAEMEAFPGQLDNAEQRCGGCHPRQTAGVRNSPMATGAGMIAVTREVFGEATAEANPGPSFRNLAHSPADSLLRKLCAGCHLGQPKTAHALDATRDRGGGCLACHINAYPANRHPRLSAKVEDARCFGCHSRSGRISLNYTGLAETDELETAHQPGYLTDGRLVEHQPPDLHHQAGLACIDCHTGPGLMNLGADPTGALDIACTDCHRNRNPRTHLADWPASQASARRRIPFAASSNQTFLRTESGTLLWHLEIDPATNPDSPETIHLHRKLADGRLPIPQIEPEHGGENHQRIGCNGCHAQWTPQCYGCHLEYDPDAGQWDHVAGGVTPGQWTQRRWHVVNAAPTLGFTKDGVIDVMVPGMVMRVEMPEGKNLDAPKGETSRPRHARAPRLVRRFAPLSPHTTGKARSCADCHRSPRTLGLGEGRLEIHQNELRFEPALPPLEDGLALDAWTGLERPEHPADPVRPFTADEIETLFRALDKPIQATPSTAD